MMKAHNLNIYLLRVLCTLLSEHSVSRTAVKLNEAQPAISRALKRLREIFDDPLLVRGKNEMLLTDRALEIQTSANVVLTEMEQLLKDQRPFDPKLTECTFRIGSPDFLAAVFLTDLVAHLRQDAPNARLVVKPLTPDFDYEGALANGQLDLVISNWPEPPENLHLSVILEDEIVLLMSKNHPLANGKITPEHYLEASHVVPFPYSFSQTGVVETHLSALQVKRNATIVLPYFGLAPYLLLNTDLIFTTSRHFAQHYVRFLPLAIVPSPIDFPPMRFYLLWHERIHNSTAQQWFRSLVKKCSRKVLAPNPAARLQ